MRIAAALIVVLLPALGLGLAGRPVLGRILLAVGQAPAAARVFDDPASKGLALYAAERWDAAADAFALAAQPYNRGNALARAGHYAEALEAYDAALVRDPDDEDARANSAIVAGLLGAGKGPGKTQGGMANADATRQIQGARASPVESAAASTGTGLAGFNEAASRDPGGAGGGSKPGGSSAGAERAGSGKAAPSGSNAAGEGGMGGLMAEITRLMAARDLRAARRREFHAVLATEDWLKSLPDDPGAYLKLEIRAEAERRRTRPQSQGDDD